MKYFFSFSIAEPPTFVKLLDPFYTIKDYDDTEMRIRVNGVPKAKIQWFKNGKELSTGDRITIETNSEGQVQSAISISHFNESDQGQVSKKKNLKTSLVYITILIISV